MSLVDGGDGDGDVVHPLLAAEVGGPGDGGITSLGLQRGDGCRDVAKKKGDDGGGALVAAVTSSS